MLTILWLHSLVLFPCVIGATSRCVKEEEQLEEPALTRGTFASKWWINTKVSYMSALRLVNWLVRKKKQPVKHNRCSSVLHHRPHSLHLICYGNGSGEDEKELLWKKTASKWSTSSCLPLKTFICSSLLLQTFTVHPITPSCSPAVWMSALRQTPQVHQSPPASIPNPSSYWTWLLKSDIV